MGALRKITPRPLTPEAFASFGDIIDVDNAKQNIPINQGYTTRFHDLADIDVADNSGDVCINIFRSKPMNPIVIKMMERHPLGSQAFIPLHKRPYLVVVAPAGDFDLDALRVFQATGAQGVNYAKGVWHHFLLALEAQSDFLVVDRKGQGNNLDEITLTDAQQFEINI